MKIINESKKENLPVEFMTQFVSKGWEEVGNLKSSLEGVKQTFKGSQKVENIIQGLMDAYLIAIGQMEGQLNNKIDMPEDKELKESLTESNEEDAESVQALKYEGKKCKDGKCYKKTEIFTELPDYDVEVEQKGEKLEIELEPKEKVGKYIGSGEMVGGDFGDDEWPEPDMSDTSDIDAARSALSNGQLNFSNNAFADQMQSVAFQPSVAMSKPTQAKSIVDINDGDWFVDFDEPDMSVPKLTDTDIYGNNK